MITNSLLLTFELEMNSSFLIPGVSLCYNLFEGRCRSGLRMLVGKQSDETNCSYPHLLSDASCIDGHTVNDFVLTADGDVPTFLCLLLTANTHVTEGI